MYYYEVAVPVALRKNLTYSSERPWKSGDSVQVPLQGRVVPGIVIQQVEVPLNSYQIKSILSECMSRTRLSSHRLKWLKWLSEYYQYSPGLVFHSSFPPTSSSKKKVENSKIPEVLSSSPAPLLSPLNEQQKQCVQAIQSYSEREFRVHLVHGVTGSGKTEVYFHLIQPLLLKKKVFCCLFQKLH